MIKLTNGENLIHLTCFILYLMSSDNFFFKMDWWNQIKNDICTIYKGLRFVLFYLIGLVGFNPYFQFKLPSVYEMTLDHRNHGISRLPPTGIECRVLLEIAKRSISIKNILLDRRSLQYLKRFEYSEQDQQNI